MSTNNFSKYVRQWYRQYYTTSKRQLYFQFHITRACESRCPHCYFRDLSVQKGILTLEQCKHIIDQIVSASNAYGLNALVDFTGGDPLLHPNIYEILEYASQNDISVGLKCNSHQITKKSIDKLKQVNVERIYLSLEGLENANDRIRGVGDFSRTTAAIAMLKNEGLYVRVHMTISKQNCSEVIPLMNFFLENKYIIDVFSWSRFWTDTNKKMLLDKNELSQIMFDQLAFLEQNYNDNKFYIELDNGRVTPRIGFEFKEHLWFPFLYRLGYIDDITYRYLSETENSVNCTSTRNVFIIDNNGDIYKCRKIEASIIGNAFHSTVLAAITSEKNRCYENLKRYSVCGNCSFFNVCAGCPAIALAKRMDQYSGDPDCFIHSLDINR